MQAQRGFKRSKGAPPVEVSDMAHERHDPAALWRAHGAPSAAGGSGEHGRTQCKHLARSAPLRGARRRENSRICDPALSSNRPESCT